MTKECIICHRQTIFFIWSTSRNVDKQELDKIVFVEKRGVPICMECARKGKILRDRPVLDLNKPRKHTLWMDMPKREESRIW